MLEELNKTLTVEMKKPSIDHLTESLAKLKNKITEARHAAQSVSVKKL